MYIMDMLINISLILAQLWTFGVSVIKLSVTLKGKFIIVLETLKLCTEEWSLIDRKLLIGGGKMQERYYQLSQKQKKDKK